MEEKIITIVVGVLGAIKLAVEIYKTIKEMNREKAPPPKDMD